MISWGGIRRNSAFEVAMPNDQCPACGGSKAITGIMYGQGQDAPVPGFVPDHTRRILGYPTPVVPRDRFRACLSCGHLWASLNIDELRLHIEQHGVELVKQVIAEMDHGPCRDLPDTAWGRMVGANISELDALVFAGRSGLVGRYREMRGVIWDQAIEETKGWYRKSREEKLALFGWVPKEKASKDDLDELL